MTGNRTEKYDLGRLRNVVEQRFGTPLATDREYRSLSDHIFSTIGERLSPTTLKRLWGYLDENVAPRQYTISLLARYAGYRDWEAFLTADTGEPESGPSSHVILNVAKDLIIGDALLLSWLPGRECRVTYLGDCRFRIEEVRGTRLLSGIIFECPEMISGEPLYISILEGADRGSYVCGKRQGVRIERIEKDKNGLGG